MQFLMKGGLACCAALVALLSLSSPAMADPFYYENTSGGPIGPGIGDDLISEILITDSGSIADMDVYVELSHDMLHQLDVFLINMESGIKVKLFDNFPGSGTVAAMFDDEATDYADPALNGGLTPPYLGVYKPDQPLWKFNGLPLAGTWRLFIDDEGFGGSGRLSGFAISGVTHSPEPGSMALLGMGLAGMAGYVRRRRRKQQQAA